MKKACWATALLSIILLPALMAQGSPGKGPVPISSVAKICAWGSVSYSLDLAGRTSTVAAQVRLQRSGRPVTGVIVRIQDTALEDMGDGSYRGQIWHYKRTLGDTLTLSADFSRLPPLSSVPGPYSGRMKLAEFTIANTVEWIFPVHDQVIDLSAFPSGVPVRWNFTGVPGDNAHLLLKTDFHTVFAQNVSGEELTIPAGTMLPGKHYLFLLIDETHYFKVSTAFDPSSIIRFHYGSIIAARTQSAAK